MITLTFKDDRYYLTPGALAWLKETERILNDDIRKRQDELASFGSVEVAQS